MLCPSKNVLKRRCIIFSIIFEMEFSKLMGRKFSFLLKLFPAFGMRTTIAVLLCMFLESASLIGLLLYSI
jgi:hypothetical protein